MLDIAVERGLWKVVPALLDRHVDYMREVKGKYVPPNLIPSFTHCLRQACKFGIFSVVEYFTKHKFLVDWNYTTLSGWNSLHIALKNRYISNKFASLTRAQERNG